MMKLKPLHDWAVLVPSEARRERQGGCSFPIRQKKNPAKAWLKRWAGSAWKRKNRAKKEGRRRTKIRSHGGQAWRPGALRELGGPDDHDRERGTRGGPGAKHPGPDRPSAAGSLFLHSGRRHLPVERQAAPPPAVTGKGLAFDQHEKEAGEDKGKSQSEGEQPSRPKQNRKQNQPPRKQRRALQRKKQQKAGSRARKNSVRSSHGRRTGSTGKEDPCHSERGGPGRRRPRRGSARADRVSSARKEGVSRRGGPEAGGL